jgi:hypothetical protein
MILEFLNEVEKKFDLKKLCRVGIVKATDIRDREIFLKFDALKKSGKKTNDCIYILCEETNLCFSSVKNAIRKMKG